MSLTSLNFFVIFLISIGLYYIVSKEHQWKVLLVYSFLFFFASSTWYTVISLLICIAVTYYGGTYIDKAKKKEDSLQARRLLAVALVINVGMLFALKYTNFFTSNINSLLEIFGVSFEIPLVNWTAPIGISFYTLISVAYLLDVYWGTTSTCKSPFKTALFISYYPLLTSGPVIKYQNMKRPLFAEHDIKWINLTFGLQRILWGIFKKLVLSSRLGTMVDSLFNEGAGYDGIYIWLGAFLFMMQLYTDFSGCMDIIIGASQCYGIRVPENFRTPFFSRTVQEFWQRWHITLGAWLKDYILFPVMRSKLWSKMTKWIKEHLGKKAAKKIPSYLGMLVVWLLIGLWHGGGWKFILGMGIWFWGCIVLEQLLEPLGRKITSVLKIKREGFGFRLFQAVRTFILVAIGNMFFRLSSLGYTFALLKRGLKNIRLSIFTDGSMLRLGLNERELVVVAVGLLLLLAVSIIQETKGNIWNVVARQNVAVRWTIWFGLIFAIIILGEYGPGYDAGSFIYGNF